MASTRGRKSRTQQRRRSWKERTSQHGRTQKSHGRRSPSKQRKHHGRAKHRSTTKQKNRALKWSLHSIHAEMLDQPKQEGLVLSHQAKGLTGSVMKNIYKVLSEAKRLRRESHDPIISTTHVRTTRKWLLLKRRWRNMSTTVFRYGC